MSSLLLHCLVINLAFGLLPTFANNILCINVVMVTCLFLSIVSLLKSSFVMCLGLVLFWL